MFACGPCHDDRRCPAGKHERIYWAKCELCGKECQCYECMLGEKMGPAAPETARKLRAMYLNVKRIEYSPRRKRKE